MTITFITKEQKAAARANEYAEQWGTQGMLEVLPEQFIDFTVIYEEGLRAKDELIRVSKVYSRTNLKPETKAKYATLYSEASSRLKNLREIFMLSGDMLNRAYEELDSQTA
jgi:hypothetical protein